MNHLSKSLGKLRSVANIRNGVRLETDYGVADIIVYNPHTLRFRIRRDLDERDFSYAVVGKPARTEFSVEEDRRSVRILTAELQVHVSKSPVRIKVLDRRGDVINEDEASFGTSWIGDEVTTYKKLQDGERFIGLGEKTRNLDRRGEAFTNWNTDAFGYGAWDDPLYLSTPFYIGINGKHPYGIFLDNTYRTTFNFGASNDRFASFTAEGGEMNYYFMYDRSIAGILKAYSELTGYMPLPPKWSLGYQQCRYSYYPESRLMALAQTFRDKNIPCDVLYLDIHYKDAYKVFTWDRNRFPKPKEMIRTLKKMGFHVVIIADPGIKVQSDYKPYRDGIEQDLFLKYPDGQPYLASVWPGKCHFPDYTKAETRRWWGDQFKMHTDEGLEGFWNDMNEPATWGQNTPDLVEFDYDGDKSSHKRARNVYGMQMARSTYEGARRLMKRKRPFILTRSGFSGVQRYAAVWTGDNVANNESMMLGVRLINSLGLTGIPFAGYDVGGFVGETEADLYIRWITIAAFSPFFRGHTMINTRSSEPWAYGEEAEDITRHYINLRYRMLPYIYSVFREASISGMPVARSLAIDYTNDEQVYSPAFQHQYLFGPSLLVAPVESDKAVVNVYLPKGTWYSLYNDRVLKGGREVLVEAPKDKLPVFVKGGAIVPMQSVVQHTEEKPLDVLSVHVYNGPGTTEFEYYEDDGSSYGFEKGEYLTRTVALNSRKKTISLSPAKGTYAGVFKSLRVYLHGFSLRRSLRVNGRTTVIHRENYVFIGNVSNFDPFSYSPDLNREIKELPYIEIPLLKKELIIQW